MKSKNECKGLTFADCELAILRMAVDEAGEKIGKRIVNSDDVQNIIKIVENFIKKKSLICYGGTAVNNILPLEDQFYNKDAEVPDYDFFTPDALNDAKELADEYFKLGFTDVEAKAGQHYGTYKVFVNYMPVADLTQLPKEIYGVLKIEAVRVAGILYAPPNFLRMSMYLELSRPVGDTSRWEKVLKRLTLLNKHYPLTSSHCDKIEFQRKMEDTGNQKVIYETVKNTLINQGVVFFGGFAISLYSQYMPHHLQKQLQDIADFDVLSNEPETTAEIIKERLKDENITNVKIVKREPAGEIVPEHYEILVGKETVAFIYKPVACHSYNTVDIHGQKIKIATIDTMLSFYLAFLYADRPYYNQFLDRILCMSKFLFEVQQKNRLQQKGLLKRFSITCYGHQESVEEIRAHKSKKYQELKANKDKKEFEKWFLNYRPETILLNKGVKMEMSNSKTHNARKISKTVKPKKTKKAKKTRKSTIKSLFNIYSRRRKQRIY